VSHVQDQKKTFTDKPLKKVFSILFSAFFLVTSIGFTYTVSTCSMQKKADVSLSTRHSCCCSGNLGSGCCKHEVHFVKLTDSYTASNYAQVAAPFPQLIPVITPLIQLAGVDSRFNNVVQTVNLHSPPPRSGIDRCTLFGIYLI